MFTPPKAPATPTPLPTPTDAKAPEPRKRILIIDVETTGKYPEVDDVIEIGAVAYDVPTAQMLGCFSSLVKPARSVLNAMERINKIPDELLVDAPGEAAVLSGVLKMYRRLGCTWALAHNAAFDSAFLPSLANEGVEWLDSHQTDLWDVLPDSGRLVDIALNLGVGVTHAHRALPDCLLLASCLARVAERDPGLERWLDAATAPRMSLLSKHTYDHNENAKALGFRWNATKREWIARNCLPVREERIRAAARGWAEISVIE